MNVNTGEIIRLHDGEMRKRFEETFKPVPADLSEEAEKILGDQERAFADMSNPTPLTEWAKSQQVHTGPNRASRRRMAKESRRKNRRY